MPQKYKTTAYSIIFDEHELLPYDESDTHSISLTPDQFKKLLVLILPEGVSYNFVGCGPRRVNLLTKGMTFNVSWQEAVINSLQPRL